MRFKGLDLNLLVVFDSLMHTRSVSRSADQLNLSQPAISSALRRLRDYFSDDILVPHGKRMIPTAHAEELQSQVRDSLRVIEGLIATSAGFDPATARRTFRLCGSDYMAAALFAPLSRQLATEAPNIRLELILNDDRSWVELEQGTVDLVVTPEDYIARELPAEHLLDERHVVIGWTGNPLMPDGMDEAAFLAAGHVQVAIGYNRTTVYSDRHLEKMGKQRRVEVIAASFAMAPLLIIETDRIALLQERLAHVIARHYPIAVADIPFPFPVMREMMQYNPARVSDPGLIWLRGKLKEQAILRVPTAL